MVKECSKIVLCWQSNGLECWLLKRGYDFELSKEIINVGNRFNIPSPLQTQWYTGYTIVQKEHPLFKKEYAELEDHIDVHGGVNFADHPHFGEWVDKSQLWAFGWDSMHGVRFNQYEAKYETEKLARQISEWKKFV